MELTESRELGKLYRKGEIIFKQGDRAGRFFSVQKGRVVMNRTSATGKQVQMEIGAGEIFGIASVFTQNRERFATATAAEDTVVVGIDEKWFIARIHQDPSIAFRIIRHLSHRLFEMGQADEKTAPETSTRPRRPSSLHVASNLASGALHVQDFSTGYHILLLEDDIIFAEIVRAWLGKADAKRKDGSRLPTYRLTHVSSLAEADALLHEVEFDLILMDLHLPDGHGYEETFLPLLAQARQTPVIVLTSLDDDQTAIQAVEEGAEDYLVKQQCNRKSVLRAIHYAISRHKKRLPAPYPSAPLDDSASHAEWSDMPYVGALRNWLHRYVHTPALPL
ncbi:MAG: cyclic nucleotide-binding domain-containing protein [Magnetococcales bacterium]|nr:cyclic nucleotide-binding domain-containing protein [Magnetococcales bacterium]